MRMRCPSRDGEAVGHTEPIWGGAQGNGERITPAFQNGIDKGT
jgi:hypothetical protein